MFAQNPGNGITFFADLEQVPCTPQLQFKMAKYIVKVLQTDMEKHKEEFAVELIQTKYLEIGQPRLLTRAVKLAMDSEYGGTHHCIAGKTFGSCITYRTGSFILVEINQTTLMIFEAD